MTTAGKKRYLRYIHLLQEGGSLVLKGIINREVQKEGKTLSQILLDNNGQLRQFIRNDLQYELIFPSASPVNSELDTWDISLLCLVLLYIFGSKLTLEECNGIKKICSRRNEFYGQFYPSLGQSEYSRCISDLSIILLNLSIGLNREIYNICQDLIYTIKYEPIQTLPGDFNEAMLKQVQHLDEGWYSLSSTPEPDINDLFLDPDTIKQFNIAIKEGKDEDKTIRAMIIGCHGQGKTTLARRLLGQTLDGIESTHGIDLHKAVCSKDVYRWYRLTNENIQADTIKRLAQIQVEQTKEPEVKGYQKQSDKVDNKSDKNDDKSDKIDNKSDKIDNNQHLPRLNGDTRDDELKYKGDVGTDSRHRLNELSDNTIENAIVTDNLKHRQLQRQRSSQIKEDLKLFEKYKTNLPEEEQGNEKISLWDFGGQFVFYATHQLFHSRNAVYLLVFDLHKDLDFKVLDEDNPGETSLKSMKDFIEFWVTSVHSYVGSKDASRPKIILVGTHKDKLANENVAENYFESIRQLFDGRKLLNHIHSESFAILATDMTDDTVEQLRATIMNIGRQRKRIIPARWLRLEMELKRKQQLEKVNIMNFKEVMEINDEVMDHPLKSVDEIKSFLKFHHATGAFVYFDEGEMAQYVIINPQFIIDAFKCIITSGKFCKLANHLRPLWKQLTKKAILKEELVQAIWENDANDGEKCHFKDYKTVLLLILQRHKIIAKAHAYDADAGNFIPQDYYIVPSFLPKATNREIENFLASRNCTGVSLVYIFDNEEIVPTVFHRVIGAAVGSLSVIDYRGCTLLYENAAVFRLKKDHAGVILRSEEIIELLVVNLRTDEIISAEIPNFLRRFVENVIKNEFQKLVSIDNEFPFSTAVRCYNKLHSFEGSKAKYDLEELKSQQEKSICCPDFVAHESIDIEGILNEWFKNDFSEKKIPERKLSSQEYVQLSRAFGEEWSNLGRFLGVDNVTIQQIVMDNSTTASRIYAMLLEWENRKSDEATLDVLVKAIEKLPRHTINFDIVNNIIDDVYS